jgi:pyruvate formate lyase activating enzyme
MREGQAGFCFIRRHTEGRLETLGYGRTTGFAVDPIEKKPLNHFLPGTGILSFGTAGCNLGCKFCQNWDISKARIDDTRSHVATPDQVVALAKRHDCPSIAFTYNDPVIIGEYVVDVSRAAREGGLKSVAVTAGYITPEARPDVFRYLDGANVDLKAFTERFYQKVTLSELAPVLDTLIWIRNETDVWLELTTLLIPGLNDDPQEIRRECDWIAAHLGPATPLHFTAFHPDYRMRDIPATPLATVLGARKIARDAGLIHVYVGNVIDDEGQTTFCSGCGAALITRRWHDVRTNRLIDGACGACGTPLPGIF